MRKKVETSCCLPSRRCRRLTRLSEDEHSSPDEAEAEATKSVPTRGARHLTGRSSSPKNHDRSNSADSGSRQPRATNDGNPQPPRINVAPPESGGSKDALNQEPGKPDARDQEDMGKKSKGKQRHSGSSFSLFKKKTSKKELASVPSASLAGKNLTESQSIRSESSATTRSHSLGSTHAQAPSSATSISGSFAIKEPSFTKKGSGGVATQEDFTAPFSKEALDKEHEAAQKQAVETQKNTGFWHRSYYWVAEDRTKFKDLVEDIRKGVNVLESLLPYKVPDDIQRILNVTKEPSALQKHATISKAIHRLHKSLAAHNAKKGPLVIAVKLAIDSTRDLQVVSSQEDHLAFRDDAYFFILQARKPSVLTSIRVGAETTVNVPAGADLAADFRMDKLGQLDEISTVPINDELEGDWSKLAAVWQNGSPSDVHRLFYVHGTRFDTKRTLENILDLPSFKDISPAYRAQLAMLLAIPHLYFNEVLDGLPDPIVRPSHFEYYLQTDAGARWDDIGSFIRTPYLSIGVGSKPPKVDIGAESGVVDKVHHPLIEIGLLLYQIASGERIDYGNGIEGLRAAGEKALRRLHTVDTEFGAPFTELVESCLSNEEGEASHLKGVYGKLEEIWDELKKPKSD